MYSYTIQLILEASSSIECVEMRQNFKCRKRNGEKMALNWIFTIRILTNDAVLFYTLAVSVSTCYLFYPNRTRRFLWLSFYWLDTSPQVLSPSSGIYTPTYYSCITIVFRFVNADLFLHSVKSSLDQYTFPFKCALHDCMVGNSLLTSFLNSEHYTLNIKYHP